LLGDKGYDADHRRLAVDTFALIPFPYQDDLTM
jgi:hypothetical protein